MTLKLNGIDVDCVIGERPDERTRLQTLRVDVELEISDVAADTDSLSDTVDYAALTERIRAALASAKCRMIERAADYIAAAYRHSQFGGRALEIVMSGSVLLKAATPRFLDDMRAAVELRVGQRILWLTPQHTPVYGAAAWLKKLTL